MYRLFRFSFAILSITLATRLPLYAQGYDPGECAHSIADQHAAYKVASETPVVPTVGTFRALVVFVRFYDDTDDWTGSCWPNLSQWADPDQLPSKVESGEEMLPEYDFSVGERGKYAKRFAEGSNIVVVAPDLVDVFPTSDSVNEALREVANQRRSQRGFEGGERAV